MKLIFVNNEVDKKALEKGKIALVAGTVAGSLAISLCGCTSREVATNANVTYDVIDTMDQDLVNQGIQQILDVPGEDFKLVVNYRCILDNNARWTITSDKLMYMDVCTQGLKDDTQVYIDNVHIDTTIRSVYPTVDGITQDTMDDRIHNSQMVGFPISDNNKYSNVNCIEGQNQTFMQGSYYGFVGTSGGASSGSITQKRYIESDYLRNGVYANKISSVIDLIVVKDGKTTCISVPSTIGVSVWPYIERQKSNGEKVYDYYYYNESKGYMESKVLNAEEFNESVKTYTKSI